MLRKSTVTGPRESKFYQKPISRRFCFFEIKSNWSILNQIMVSLFLLTFLTLVFVTSQVILGLYISKYFFAQFSQEIIYNKTVTLFQNEAKIIQKTVNQPFASPSYSYAIENQTITKIAQQALSIPADGNSSDSISLQSEKERFFLVGNNVYYPNNSTSSIVVMFVNMTDVSQYDDQLQDEIEQDFNANVLYTSYLIGGSFLLILLLGWCFAYYIVRPLKKLAEYAQHINNNTTRLTMGKMSKVKPIELEEIKAQDKIGELINEFKNLIQGLAGLKKGNIQKKSKEIKPFLEGYENQNQEDFRIINLQLMKPYLKFDTVTRFPQTPLQIEQKPLFKLPDTIMQRRKTAQAPFRRSLHQNKSPVNFERQKIEELRSTIAQLTEVNTELATLNQALQDQIAKLQENNKSLQQQIHQMNIQIDDLKINNRHLRSQDNSMHVQSKTFDQRLQDQSNHIVFLQLQLRKLNDQLEQQKTQQINHPKIEAIHELESICLELRSFVLCKYCNQELKEPVTIIPCAHSYCKQCKLGYQKHCFLCGPDEEIEASYVNLSLMPIVKFYKKSLQIKETLK